MNKTRVFRRCAIGWCVLALAGCASVNDLGLSLFASKVDSYLLVNGQVLTGAVYLIPGRNGRVAFSSEEGPITACNGTMRYSGTNTAEIDLHCSDASSAVLQVTLITDTRGFAFGRTESAPVNLAFGLSEAAAQAYLGRQTDKKPVSEDRAAEPQ